MKSLNRYLSNFSINPRPVHRLKLNTLLRLTFILLLGGAGLTACANLQQEQTADKQENDVTVSYVEQMKTRAEQGDAEAQRFVGQSYWLGSYGFPQDEEKGAYWLRLAAEQGDVEARDSLVYMCTQLGWNYYKGEYVEQDDEMAVYWFKRAAEQGSAEARNYLGMAYTGLGLKYWRGEGVEQDDEMAVYWFRLAAEQGSATAQFALGWKHELGEGVEQDDEMAVYWFKRAAEQGHDPARAILDMRCKRISRYGRSRVASRDDQLAMYCYRKLAEQGDVSGHVALSRIYEKGRGVPRNYVYAYMWMNIAASDGFEKAVELQNILEKEMTPSQIQRAKELARACELKQYKDCEV